MSTTITTTARGSKNRRMFITGVLSAILYGGWAYYVNAGLETAMASAMVQALGSFIGGYLVAGLVEFAFSVTPRPWRFPIAAFVPYGLTLLTYAAAHRLVGTPEILKTIMLNIIVGTPYFVLYCVKLERNEAQRLIVSS
ncbi:hypothetical protein LOY37_14810 [Pseudomonas sp. B21-012]|uniref:hypothetical protein n=1 Tax=Pseudomonas sp. B21-012 TaxID=2895472 RepID=UPI00216045E0|nr:hypothetical protein [Pseudomonas sp. B21-012]UVM53646.1 hypothetical protein LOY37_14810 [Pseudomonas sp. B21-012]